MLPGSPVLAAYIKTWPVFGFQIYSPERCSGQVLRVGMRISFTDAMVHYQIIVTTGSE